MIWPTVQDLSVRLSVELPSDIKLSRMAKFKYLLRSYTPHTVFLLYCYMVRFYHLFGLYHIDLVYFHSNIWFGVSQTFLYRPWKKCVFFVIGVQWPRKSQMLSIGVSAYTKSILMFYVMAAFLQLVQGVKHLNGQLYSFQFNDKSTCPDYVHNHGMRFHQLLTAG